MTRSLGCAGTMTEVCINGARRALMDRSTDRDFETVFVKTFAPRCV